MLTDSQRSSFANDGFIILKSLVSSEELKRFELSSLQMALIWAQKIGYDGNLKSLKLESLNSGDDLNQGDFDKVVAWLDKTDPTALDQALRAVMSTSKS